MPFDAKCLHMLIIPERGKHNLCPRYNFSGWWSVKNVHFKMNLTIHIIITRMIMTRTRIWLECEGGGGERMSELVGECCHFAAAILILIQTSIFGVFRFVVQSDQLFTESLDQVEEYLMWKHHIDQSISVFSMPLLSLSIEEFARQFRECCPKPKSVLQSTPGMSQSNHRHHDVRCHWLPTWTTDSMHVSLLRGIITLCTICLSINDLCCGSETICYSRLFLNVVNEIGVKRAATHIQTRDNTESPG